jgi:3-isopropylmalate/(R)-2-methylmalate dehydratase small subunit
MSDAPTGRAFVFGDKIDTDVLAPGSLMKLTPEDLARHCLEAVDPNFAKDVRPGDFVIGGASFGIGSSREQAAISLKLLGVRAVLALSFARIFYRNAFNVGLPALFFPQAHEVRAGDVLSLDLAVGQLVNKTQNRTYALAAVPDHLRKVVEAGGLIAYLKNNAAAASGGIGG